VPWQIGVTHPLYAGELAAIVRIHDGAVATSGTAERGHHVVNPLTGEPATALASVTVVGAHLTWVDVVATAALARGADARRWLTALDGVEALAVAADGSGWWTPGFPAYGTVPHSPLPGSHQPGLSELAES
jgi:thiamine biosynthesis lipoprotein